MLHWQTRSHAEHVTLGEFYEEFNELVDRLIETSQRDERLKFDDLTLEIHPFTGPQYALNVLTGLSNHILSGIIDDLKGTERDDVRNIVEEMDGVVNRALFKLSLR